MKTVYPTPARLTSQPPDPTWLKKFDAAVGDPDEKAQAQLNYRAGVGELIWAMTMCRLFLAFASIKLLQSNSCPHKFHFHSLKHALKYLYSSWEDNIYFWRIGPHLELPEGAYLVFTATNRTFFLRTNPNSMPTLPTLIPTLIGQLA